MLHYIPVVTKTGKLLYINLDKVNVVAQEADGSHFEFDDGQITHCVMTMEHIGELIDNANKQITVFR